MSVVDVISGSVRDVVRTGLLAVSRARGDFMGRMLDPHMIDDPYPTYDWIRSEGRLVGNGFGLVTTSHDVADAILRSPHMISGNPQRDETLEGGSAVQRWLFGLPPRPGVVNPIGAESMIGMDGEGHARLRRLTRAHFSPAAIEKLRPRLTELAERLLAEARREPSFDLMNGFAGALPVTAICDLLGIPEDDRPRFRRWGGDIAADLDALTPAHRQRAASRSMRELRDYFTTFLPWRRAHPGDDVLSQLLTADGDDRLTDRELLVLSSLLVLAGFETTVNLIGNGTMALIGNPDQADLLRADPSRIPAALDELLRYDAPVQIVSRISTSEVQLAGVDVPQRVPLSIMIGGANRDPAVFTDPEKLDVTRQNARKHLSFAAGPHHCLGAWLARLEGEIAFSTLLGQLPELRLAGTPQRRRTFVMRGYRSIPLASRSGVLIRRPDPAGPGIGGAYRFTAAG